MARVRALIMTGVVLVLVAAGCGDSDDSADETESEAASPDTTAAASDDSVADESDSTAPAGGGDDSGGGGNGGTLVLGEETVSFDSARCFLEEQDAAAGGGKILFVAQAFGTNANGDPISIDVSRYDEDSQFTGDDIIVDIGDPFSDDAVSMAANGDIGTVVVDGSQLTASGLTFVDFDDMSEQAGSFEINC